MEKDSLSHHISQQYNEELERIRTRLLEMGGLVERQVQDALQALIQCDSALAERVREQDDAINGMEVTIDDECIRILARRQPAASDLRLVFAITKAITDLERVGDEACKIAQQAIQLSESSGEHPQGHLQLRHIGDQVVRMLHDALDAFARLDVDQSLEVVRRDKAVDQDYGSALRETMTYMMEDPGSISRFMNLIWSLRALERVGDHARNLAEDVIYLVQGEDVRHLGVKEVAERVNQGQSEA